MSPRAAFRSLLSNLPLPVVQRELATGEAIDFSDVGEVATAIKSEIEKAKAQGETISPIVAAQRIKGA
jgi:D-alanyl-D-alanine dipeptidase